MIMYVCMYVWVYVRTYVYVYMYICMEMYMQIYLQIHIDEAFAPGLATVLYNKPAPRLQRGEQLGDLTTAWATRSEPQAGY